MSTAQIKQECEGDKGRDVSALPGVWGSLLPYNSGRKSDAEEQPQLPPSSSGQRTVTSVLHSASTAVRLQPGMHRGGARPIRARGARIRNYSFMYSCCDREAACAVLVIIGMLRDKFHLCLGTSPSERSVHSSVRL